MNNLTDFDTSKYRLGRLCKRGHEWNNTGQTLRQQKSYSCLECRLLLAQSPERKAQTARYRSQNKEKLQKSKQEYHQKNKDRLCKKSRDWYDKNKERASIVSKNYRIKNAERIKLHGQEFRQANRDRLLLASRQRWRDNKEKDPQAGVRRYWLNREKILARQVEYRKANLERIRKREREYCLNHAETIKATAARTRKRNAIKLKEIDRLYRQSPRGKVVRQLARVRRKTRIVQNHHVHYNPEQLSHTFEMFNNTCAWCGASGVLQSDHFLPISKGGPDCIGNIIPACPKCNNSKRNYDPYEWYLKQSFFSKRRWKHILKVLGKTEVNYTVFPLF